MIQINKIKDKKILLEMWKTERWTHLGADAICLASLIVLWSFNFTLGFWILLVAWLLNGIGHGVRTFKLEEQLNK